MGDKETKLRGQVINKPKEQMWMLKFDSVSGNVVNFLGIFFLTDGNNQIELEANQHLQCVWSGSGRIQVHLRAGTHGVDPAQQ